MRVHIYVYISIVAAFTSEGFLKSSITVLKLNLCLAVRFLRVLIDFNGPDHLLLRPPPSLHLSPTSFHPMDSSSGQDTV